MFIVHICSCLFDVVLTVHRRYYVEIKCQLDETDEFLLQILLLAQHVSGTTMPIIRSSRVLYKWLLSVVFGAWFSRLQPTNRTYNPQRHTVPTT
jgi:hypothetical protein